MYNEYADNDNRKELMAGMNYLAKTDGIDIDTLVFFIELAIEETVKTNIKLGGTVTIDESSESGISPLMVIPRSTQKSRKIFNRKRRLPNTK